MNLVAAVLVGSLTGFGLYLVVQRDVVRIAFGFGLLTHAANVLLILAGFGSLRGDEADPLPQAFVLTAVVIGLAVTAFLFVVAYRLSRSQQDEDRGGAT